ncbi:histidine phosphatase family protein [Gracilibacillus timonensis]|uniref:histidine phosphatase family protein n=1 Tax=Gracilibacillus timonensis TaxID=1816696 RepID=UPI000825236E|nr:histidine phosphatase family protein [Gracilibacillus timonensis]
MAVYLVRHGRDEEGYRGGWSQKGLIEEGRQQAKQLAAYLVQHQDQFSIVKIISSDLNRASQTASYISEALDLPMITSTDWRETNNGVLAGMPNEEANRRYPGLYFNRLKMEERYPGGESPQEFFTRIKKAFQKICQTPLAKSNQENVLIVTHGGVINIIYHLLKGKEWSNHQAVFPVGYTSLHGMTYQNGNWTLTQENGMEYWTKE